MSILLASPPPQTERQPQRKSRRLVRFALGALAAIFVASALAAVLGWKCAKAALFVEGGRRHADLIVILGGDPGDRVFQAARIIQGRRGCRRF